MLGGVPIESTISRIAVWQTAIVTSPDYRRSDWITSVRNDVEGNASSIILHLPSPVKCRMFQRDDMHDAKHTSQSVKLSRANGSRREGFPNRQRNVVPLKLALSCLAKSRFLLKSLAVGLE